MTSSAIFVWALISLCSAQTTVSLFLPAVDQIVVASLITSDVTATTYLVGCPTPTSSLASGIGGRDDSSCTIPVPFSVTQGPKTVLYTFGIPNEVTFALDCSLGGTTSAFCTESMGGPLATGTDAGITSSGVSGVSVASAFVPVMLVTNAAQIQNEGESLTNSANSVASGLVTSGEPVSPSSTDTASRAAATTSPATVTASETPTALLSGIESAASVAIKPSTAGMPQVTGNAGWVVGGIVAAAAVAAL